MLIYTCKTFQASLEHRKLAVDLAEVIIKWEMQRIKDDQENTGVVEVRKDKIVWKYLITNTVNWSLFGFSFCSCVNNVQLL